MFVQGVGQVVEQICTNKHQPVIHTWPVGPMAIMSFAILIYNENYLLLYKLLEPLYWQRSLARRFKRLASAFNQTAVTPFWWVVNYWYWYLKFIIIIYNLLWIILLPTFAPNQIPGTPYAIFQRNYKYYIIITLLIFIYNLFIFLQFIINYKPNFITDAPGCRRDESHCDTQPRPATAVTELPDSRQRMCQSDE